MTYLYQDTDEKDFALTNNKVSIEDGIALFWKVKLFTNFYQNQTKKPFSLPKVY